MVEEGTGDDVSNDIGGYNGVYALCSVQAFILHQASIGRISVFVCVWGGGCMCL